MLSDRPGSAATARPGSATARPGSAATARPGSARALAVETAGGGSCGRSSPRGGVGSSAAATPGASRDRSRPGTAGARALVGGSLRKPYTRAALDEAGEAAALLRQFANAERAAGAAAAERSGGAAGGAGSRVAWLLRDGYGTSDVMGIRTAVRPAMRAAEPATLRPALRHLFAQQRSVATQRAIDNWELLGSLALLWPRQRLVLAVHNALREEVDNTADEGERSALQLQLERVPALLARQRRRRDALSEVWTLRRSVLESVSRRLETHTLRALVRLTDLANQQPRVRLPKPAGATSRPKLGKEAALAAAMFGGPPVLPFARPHSAAAGDARRRRRRTTTTRGRRWWRPAAAAGATRSPGDGGGPRPRLTHAQLLKVGVVARYWPEDWARMSPRLRQQTLAEGLEFVCADEPPHAEAPPQSIAGYTPRPPGSARRAPLA